MMLTVIVPVAVLPLASVTLIAEALRHLRVGAVVGVRAGVERRGQRVDIAAIGIDLDRAEGARRRRVAAAHQRIGQRAERRPNR